MAMKVRGYLVREETGIITKLMGREEAMGYLEACAITGTDASLHCISFDVKERMTTPATPTTLKLKVQTCAHGWQEIP